MLPLLRQQKDGEECLSLSDFVKPCGTDYVGAFAVTAGRGIEEIISGYQQTDDFKALLYQSLSDRLAEAATELLHARVRRDIWGYAPDERIDRQRALRAQYRGIRPAAGYPSLPDQSAIFAIEKIVGFANVGIAVTPNGAMSPASSVSGLMIAHPASRYFMIGAIAPDQRRDYAARRGITEEELSKWLPK